VDFIAGMNTVCGNGSPLQQSGMAIHIYTATASMRDRVFANGDAEMLILPDLGAIRVFTEFGILQVSPGEFALIPKGIKFRVDLLEGQARGFMAENFGLPYRLPELGLIGAHGLANAGDFQAPVAAYEDQNTPVQLVHKYAGNLWETQLPATPLDVVAWRGNLTPYKYDMYRFEAMGTATWDHPDPSIFCALSSPGDVVAGGNSDLLVIPPRWIVAERSFRPPGFHRNTVAEFAAVLEGFWGPPEGGFGAGSFLLHNNWVSHGPDTKTLELFRQIELTPMKAGGLMFMFESRYPMQVTRYGHEVPGLHPDPAAPWQDFVKKFPGK
jgi:homogentisate 1,2-dioxygenase